MIPKTNVKVVIPNMNIRGEDEVKPGLLLKSFYCKPASSLVLRNRMHNSQENIVDRFNVDYDIGACDRM